MKIKIPKKIRIDKKNARDWAYFAGSALAIILIFFGILYAVRYVKYRRYLQYAEIKEEECQKFSVYLNNEVLPLANANVKDCVCHYSNANVGNKLTPNCLCSCKLYDENGTLIDDDWNPLFSSI